MAASEESRWGRGYFSTAARTSGKLTGGRGCALEVDVCPHIAEDPGGLDFSGPGQSLLPLLLAICGPSAAHAFGYCCRSGRA